MIIDTDILLTMDEAGQDFGRVARLVDSRGAAVIVRNDAPRYLVVDFQQAEEERQLADEDLMVIARKLMEKNMEAYRELAK